MSAISEAIERQIHSNSRFWPTHYLANTWLGGKETGNVSTEDEASFSDRIDSSLKEFNGDQKELKEILLGMYQQPLLNYMKRKEESLIP